MPKPTLREWIYCQHLPPELQDDIEKLFGLPKYWRKEADEINDPPETDVSCTETLRYVAEELESLLGKE